MSNVLLLISRKCGWCSNPNCEQIGAQPQKAFWWWEQCTSHNEDSYRQTSSWPCHVSSRILRGNLVGMCVWRLQRNWYVYT